MSQPHSRKGSPAPDAGKHGGRSDQPGGLPVAATAFLVGALLTARLLVPTEGSVNGDTLWIVQLWFAAGALWAWGAWRAGEFRFRWDRLDVWLWVAVVGHVVSAVAVWSIEGDRRAAINMLWEWIGLGTAFFVWRQAAFSWPERGQLLSIMVAAAAALSCLGIYQHYVWYPRAAAEYRAVRSQLDEALKAPPAADASQELARQSHIRELQAELTAQGAPLEGPGRVLWENRLEASSEPFGTFALANTLAGFLVAWGIVAAGILLSRRHGPKRSWIGRAAAVVAIAFCLVLTKSRTAWVGLAVALAAWVAAASLGGTVRFRRAWGMAVAGACLLLMAALTAVAMTGALDRAVLTEAPKSLKYRMQYWTGAVHVVREHPLVGVGPGNFRQHYLRFKLPESSEEIADPHNFVLDLWTSGGLLGLVGLLGFLTAAVWGTSAQRADSRPPIPNTTGPAGVPPVRSWLNAGAVCGFAAVFGLSWLLEGAFDWRVAALAAAFVAFLGAIRLGTGGAHDPVPEHPGVPRACLGAAVLGLLVHLLGAGGIEMPAIVQTVVLLVGLAASPPASGLEGAPNRPAAAVALLMTLLASFAACLISATVPVMSRTALVRLGDAAISSGDTTEAEARYRRAAERDPFSPEPAERLSQTAFRRWQATRMLRDSEFERAVEFQNLAIALDRHNPSAYRQMGAMWLERYERTGDRSHAARAGDWFSQAVERYPNNSQWRADLADALTKAGRPEEAAAEAARALELDAINRANGHRDRYLADDTLARLKQMAGEGSTESPPNGTASSPPN